MTTAVGEAKQVERRLLIDGAWIETGEWQDVRSPFDGEMVARVARASADDARRAVDAAARAMEQPLPAHRRAEILDRVAVLLREREEDVARDLSAEAGKPLKLAHLEAQRAVVTFTMAAVEARKLAGSMIPMDAAEAGTGKLGFTIRRPIGIVGAITPFNFPLNLVAHKIAPALAAGCAVVLKPASQTPLSALALGELELEAGLPPGWLNVVVGPAEEIGDVLVEDDRVRLITFTGSAEVGWMLKERAARKHVLLELGNATPVLVEADADLDKAASKIAASGFAFAGQACISVQRVYILRGVYDDLVARLVEQVRSLKIGDPSDAEVDVGPVIDADARDRILSWIGEAEAAGAKVLLGGGAAGQVIEPTVLANVRPDMKVCSREVFAPVVTVTPYDSLDEAFEVANATDYGLQAGIFTQNLATALIAGERLEFGGVTVNETPTFRVDHMPYGGTKASGNTKEGPAYAVREMTEERLIVVQR
jgi:acyl-CoA reductase-like NAD-dependent aldehyde dehydrogenase